jgi:hypothetical protein
MPERSYGGGIAAVDARCGFSSCCHNSLYTLCRLTAAGFLPRLGMQVLPCGTGYPCSGSPYSGIWHGGSYRNREGPKTCGLVLANDKSRGLFFKDNQRPQPLPRNHSRSERLNKAPSIAVNKAHRVERVEKTARSCFQRFNKTIWAVLRAMFFHLYSLLILPLSSSESSAGPTSRYWIASARSIVPRALEVFHLILNHNIPHRRPIRAVFMPSHQASQYIVSSLHVIVLDQFGTMQQAHSSILARMQVSLNMCLLP